MPEMRWLETVPVLDRFTDVADPSRYVPLPDDWRIGLSDVVDSTKAIEAGRYKAVNLAGAATISAVSNALGGDLPLFVFGGDGARFAVPPEQAPLAAEALARVAAWVGRDLDLTLRVGMVGVDEIRAHGTDARAAFWAASDHVRYAMFTGRGLEWAETQLKGGAIGLAPSVSDEEPNLTGLSCQWGPILPKRGKIVSLIVKAEPEATTGGFAEIASEITAVLEEAADLNPVPEDDPAVRWPATTLGLQARVARNGQPSWLRGLTTVMTTLLMWLVFKLDLRIGGFDPVRYRREIAANTDFRKFDDALMMTLDCAPDTVERLRAILDTATARGTIRFGLHVQEEALMTCVVPSVMTSAHFHFVDGAGGGYASAARQLRAPPPGGSQD